MTVYDWIGLNMTEYEYDLILLNLTDAEAEADLSQWKQKLNLIASAS